MCAGNNCVAIFKTFFPLTMIETDNKGILLLLFIMKNLPWCDTEFFRSHVFEKIEAKEENLKKNLNRIQLKVTKEFKAKM